MVTGVPVSTLSSFRSKVWFDGVTQNHIDIKLQYFYIDSILFKWNILFFILFLLLLPKFARLADLSFMFESFMNEAESNCLLAELYDTYSCLQKSSIII